MKVFPDDFFTVTPGRVLLALLAVGSATVGTLSMWHNADVKLRALEDVRRDSDRRVERMIEEAERKAQREVEKAKRSDDLPTPLWIYWGISAGGASTGAGTSR